VASPFHLRKEEEKIISKIKTKNKTKTGPRQNETKMAKERRLQDNVEVKAKLATVRRPLRKTKDPYTEHRDQKTFGKTSNTKKPTTQAAPGHDKQARQSVCYKMTNI
jgi:hypothetical protein